jgi:methylmalonyl-CoA mutase N-terminal domain
MSDPGRPVHRSTSGSEVRTAYRAADLADLSADEAIGEPGQYPFTRGIHPDGYLGRPWTMRQYAGFGSAEETNRRFRYLLASGQTGLSVAFDLPTQMGYDSDDPMAIGEVGRVGVPIDSIADMELLLDGIALDQVSTSMTINATAAILLVLYEAVGRRRGIGADRLRGTIQNDILKEYIARGTYIFPPGPSMRLVTDTFAYCRAEMPAWNTISISGYHMREAGASAVQEVAFTWPTRSPTARPQSRQDSRSTISPRASPSSSRRTTTCSRRSPSSAPRDVPGPSWRATASAPATREAWRCASTCRPGAAL